MQQKDMKKELLSQVNPDSAIDLEKVNRYLSMVTLIQKLAAEAANEPMIVVKNGAQQYKKANPAVNEVNRLNTSLISLGRDMGLNAIPVAPKTEEVKSKGYSKDDLI